MKTVSFGNMTDYDAEAQQLAERKRYAEALRQQGQQAVPNGQMVGNGVAFATARIVGASPAAPTIALMVQSAGSAAASSKASGPASARTSDPANASRKSCNLLGSAVTATLTRRRFAASASRAILLEPVSATTSNVSAPPARSSKSSVLPPIDPVAPRTLTRLFTTGKCSAHERS